MLIFYFVLVGGRGWGVADCQRNEFQWCWIQKMYMPLIIFQLVFLLQYCLLKTQSIKYIERVPNKADKQIWPLTSPDDLDDT